MMKSWGERLVAGLKNWRSRKGDVVPDQKTDAGHGELSDQKSIKITPLNVEGKASRANHKVEPANARANEQMTVGGDEIPVSVSVRNDQISGDADKPSTSTSGLKLPARQSSAKTPEAGERLTPGKKPTPTAQEGRSADEITGRRSPANNRIKTTDQELPKQVTGKAFSKRSGELNDKTVIRKGPTHPSEGRGAFQETSAFQEPSGHRHPSPDREAANKKVAAPVVPASSRKRPLVQTQKNTDEPVTDEQLAELEAENVRLKLLLRGTLSATRNNSGNSSGG